MKAKFKKTSIILSFVFFTLGLIWSVLCIFIKISKNLMGIGDIIACSIIVIAIFLVGIFIFLYNHNAYLHIDDHKISGKFGFFKPLECDINDVDFVLAQFDTIHILLKNRKYYITGITNAYEISAFIMPKIPFNFKENKKDVIANIEKSNKNIKKNTILVFCSIGLSFLWVIITVLLTESKELQEFDNTDWIIFSTMCVLEALTIIAMFTFAIKARNQKPLVIKKQLYGIQRTTIEQTPLLKSPFTVKAVFTDAYFSHRITLYDCCIENNSDSFCYTIETFDVNLNLKFLCQSNFFDNVELQKMFINDLDITESFK